MSDKDKPTDKLSNFSSKSRKTADKLDKMANRIGVGIVLIIVGIIFFPLGIIAWIFALGAIVSAFSPDIEN
jgi:hypothetical protein